MKYFAIFFKQKKERNFGTKHSNMFVNYANLIFRLQQCEEDKITKDSQIKSLQEELVNQEELVARLQKEKKQAQMSRQEVDENLQVKFEEILI